MDKYFSKIKHLSQRLYHTSQKTKLGVQANVMTYYVLLALLPLTLILSNVLFVWGLSLNNFNKILEQLFPGSLSRSLITGVWKASLSHRASFSPSNLVAIIVTIWAASRALMALRYTLNNVLGVENLAGRFILRIFAFVVMLVDGLVAVSLGIIVVAGARAITAITKANIFVPAWLVTLIHYCDWQLLVLLGWLIVAGIYHQIPNAKLHWKSTLCASVVTTSGWGLLSWLFSLYLHYFASKTLSYGFFGTMAVFLLWINYCSLVLLLGAIVCRECEVRWYGAIVPRFSRQKARKLVKKISQATPLESKNSQKKF